MIQFVCRNVKLIHFYGICALIAYGFHWLHVKTSCTWAIRTCVVQFSQKQLCPILHAPVHVAVRLLTKLSAVNVIWVCHSYYQAVEFGVFRLWCRKERLRHDGRVSTFKVHVQLATHYLDNTAHVQNEVQKVCQYSNIMSYL